MLFMMLNQHGWTRFFQPPPYMKTSPCFHKITGYFHGKIIIVAIMHQKQKPNYWIDRL